MDSQCPGCLGQAVVTSRLPCAIVESPRRHKRAPFVNIAFLCSRSIKRRQWEHTLGYYGVVFAHLATRCGIKAKDPSGLDSDQWIPHSRCCENPARAKALAGFSRHLSAGFTDLNPVPRGLALYNPCLIFFMYLRMYLHFIRRRRYCLHSKNETCKLVLIIMGILSHILFQQKPFNGHFISDRWNSKHH